MNLHDRDIQRIACREGIAEGITLGAEETARNLLKMKLCTVEQIAQASKLPVEKILELKKAISD